MQSFLITFKYCNHMGKLSFRHIPFPLLIQTVGAYLRTQVRISFFKCGENWSKGPGFLQGCYFSNKILTLQKGKISLSILASSSNSLTSEFGPFLK